MYAHVNKQIKKKRIHGIEEGEEIQTEGRAYLLNEVIAEKSPTSREKYEHESKEAFITPNRHYLKEPLHINYS
jgi:hypothetical protein